MKVIDTFNNNVDKAHTIVLNKNIIDALFIDELIRRYEIIDTEQIAFVKKFTLFKTKDTQTKGNKWHSRARPPMWRRLWNLFIQ